MRTNTYYYEADISLIESTILGETREKETFLEKSLPLLRLMNANTRSKPKIIFLDGVENCKKTYLELLESDGGFLEF